MMIKILIQNKKKDQTIFTTSEISQITDYTGVKLKSAVKYALETNQMTRLAKGIYCLNNEYSKLELANKLVIPSYISLYTVLQQESIVFQPYFSIFTISNVSRQKEIDEQNYIYRKVKRDILLNPLGIKNNGIYSIATQERALADKIYLDGVEYFDNLNNIDWNFLKAINQKVFNNNSKILKFISLYDANTL
jgi:predicted transcriptional regulator of viral defense system